MSTADDSGVPALLARLQRLGRDQALALVRPPRPRSEVAARLASAAIPVAEPILTWYAAWDGQDAGGALGDIDVLPGFYALSLDDALAHKAHQPTWPLGWLPLLADGGGDYYVADCDSDAVRVLRHRSDDPVPEVLSPSLDRFTATAVAAFDSGVVFLLDGYLEQDDEAWQRLFTSRE
jgi:hypothetical protein